MAEGREEGREVEKEGRGGGRRPKKSFNAASWKVSDMQ